MTLVIDASVVVKWLFDDPDNERYTALATDLMAAVVAGDVDFAQPPHWLIEVGAVLVSRLTRPDSPDVRRQAGVG